MDGARQVSDLQVKSCRVCRFAHGGQFFAAVQGPQILVFSTWTTELLCSLKVMCMACSSMHPVHVHTRARASR